MSAYSLPRCSKCGNSSGPWRPTGETLPESDEQALVCSSQCPAELAAAIDAMGGALPMPVGIADVTDGRLAKLAQQLGDAKPARDALLASFGQSIVDCREHNHASQHEDLHCMNLTSYMGERMAPVIRRLLNAESERDALRARVAELEAFAHGCDGEGCVLPHSSWCERAKEHAAENDGCTCPKPWPNRPQPHAGYCWLVSPPRDEVDEMRKRLAEDPHDSPLHHDYATPRDLPEVTR